MIASHAFSVSAEVRLDPDISLDRRGLKAIGAASVEAHSRVEEEEKEDEEEERDEEEGNNDVEGEEGRGGDERKSIDVAVRLCLCRTGKPRKARATPSRDTHAIRKKYMARRIIYIERKGSLHELVAGCQRVTRMVDVSRSRPRCWEPTTAQERLQTQGLRAEAASFCEGETLRSCG